MTNEHSYYLTVEPTCGYGQSGIHNLGDWVLARERKQLLKTDTFKQTARLNKRFEEEKSGLLVGTLEICKPKAPIHSKMNCKDSSWD